MIIILINVMSFQLRVKPLVLGHGLILLLLGHSTPLQRLAPSPQLPQLLLQRFLPRSLRALLQPAQGAHAPSEALHLLANPLNRDRIVISFHLFYFISYLFSSLFFISLHFLIFSKSKHLLLHLHEAHLQGPAALLRPLPPRGQQLQAPLRLLRLLRRELFHLQSLRLQLLLQAARPKQSALPLATDHLQLRELHATRHGRT